MLGFWSLAIAREASDDFIMSHSLTMSHATAWTDHPHVQCPNVCKLQVAPITPESSETTNVVKLLYIDLFGARNREGFRDVAGISTSTTSGPETSTTVSLPFLFGRMSLLV
jgi:hypothetical protein